MLFSKNFGFAFVGRRKRKRGDAESEKNKEIESRENTELKIKVNILAHNCFKKIAVTSKLRVCRRKAMINTKRIQELIF